MQNNAKKQKMNKKPQIFCVGSIVWDIIGRSKIEMPLGADRPGDIIKIPGGVALNLAMKLRKNNIQVTIIGVIGKDTAGKELLEQVRQRGITTDHIYISKDLPTDTYIAIEGANGLIGAIADFRTLENQEKQILTSLQNVITKLDNGNFRPIIALDGNLSERLLRKLNYDTKFKSLDLRIAPASPGKAKRLKSCLNGNITTIYVNLEEANLILNQTFLSSRSAAEALAVNCNTRVIVTDGPKSVTLIADDKLISAKPPTVKVARITGAGDVFMASHIQAEVMGHKHLDAIEFALNQTAKYISSSDKL